MTTVSWHILIVDKNEEEYARTRAVLQGVQGQPVDLTWAQTYQAAQQQIQSQVFDAILVSEDLGTHTGIELIQALAAGGYPAAAILLNGSDSYELDLKAMRAGAAAYIPRSEASPALLERTIRYAIEHKQTEQALRERESALKTSADALYESETQYQRLFESMLNGFALHEILCDPQNRPVDYRFLVVNPAFEKMTGLKAAEVVGKRVREVLPGIEDQWIETYGQVALTGKPVRFESYAAPLNRYYEVYAFRPRKNQFATLFLDVTERRRTEAELKKTKEEYQLLVEHQTDMVALMSREGRRLYVNPNFLAMVGKTEAEVLDSDYAPELHPDDVARVAQEWEKTFQPPYYRSEIEARTRTVRGWRWLSWRNVAILDEQGQPTRAVSVGRDVTDIKQVEAALRESESLYHTIARTIPDGGVWVVDQNLRFLAVEGPLAEMQGLPHEGMEGKGLEEGFPGLTDLVEPRFRKALAGESESYETPYRGRVVWTRYLPLVDQDGKIFAAMAMAIDISARKRVEDALRASEAALRQSEGRLRKLVEGNIIGIDVRDVEGRLKDANRAFLDMIGYSEEDLRAGRLHLRSLTPQDCWSTDQAMIQEVQETGSCKPYEKEYIHKDGHIVPALVGYTRLEETSEEFIGFVLDMSELKAAQDKLADYAERLKQSNMELEQFAFVASHDLQEPLRKIHMFGGRLSSQLSGKLDESSEDIFKRMINASDRMQEMIQDLLQLSRISTRAQPFTRVNLADVLDQVISDLEGLAQRVDGEIEVKGVLPEIDGDALQMHQLLQNLIGNALKFHQPDQPPHVTVSARVEKAKNQVVISVKDNGIGFEVQYFERILEPFQRLHGRNEYEGTGMGLAICKRIVDRHHGKIEAESQLDEGTTFIVTLPLWQKE